MIINKLYKTIKSLTNFFNYSIKERQYLSFDFDYKLKSGDLSKFASG